MHSDSIFLQGSTHKVCEDYALNGKTSGMEYAAISDGCSSSKNTDLGARILLKCMENTMSVMKEPEHFGFEQLTLCTLAASSGIVGSMRLPTTVLDCTIGLVRANDSMVTAGLYGDGYIIVGMKSNKLDITKIEFSQNYPYYATYTLDSIRDASIKSIFKNRMLIHTMEMDMLEARMPEWHLANDRSVGNAHVVSFPSELVSFVLIASDGLGTFMINGVQVSDVDIINEMFQFKGLQGEFLQRRVGAFLRSYRDIDIQHQDDFSVAGVVV